MGAIASSRFSRRAFLGGAAGAGAALVLPTVLDADARAATLYPSRNDLLARTNLQTITGQRTTPFRADRPGDLYALDARTCTLLFQTTDSNHCEITVGKWTPGTSPGIVGGYVVGQIPRDADWQTAKTNWDAAGIRLQGLGPQVCYDARITNMEDGFEPNPGTTASGNTTDTFLLDGAYMSWIRDDAVENDRVMNGVINDCLFDGVNRFLSEQADSTGTSNPTSVVTVTNCLVHLVPMPNVKSKSGLGYGGAFKWKTGAGSVDVSDTIFLLDQPPIYAKPWPPGTYTNVTVILGPNYVTSTVPSYLPASVTVTSDTTIWHSARQLWLATHPPISLG
jgi:hypothetical protein